MTTLPARARRFMDEDAATFASTCSLGVGALMTREFRLTSSSSSSISTLRRLQLAARKTLPMLPFIAVSSAVGIVGIKLTLAAVQDARRDYSRTSVLIAVPLFAALMHAPGGARLMAKSAVGYGGFILAADYAAFHWHQYNHALEFDQHCEQARKEEEEHASQQFHDSSAWIRRGVVHDSHGDMVPFGRERPVMLVQRLAEEN